MKSRSFLKKTALLLLVVSLAPAAYAQQLSYTNPQNLSVCDSAFFEVQIANDSSLILENAQLQVWTPPCLELLQPTFLSIPSLQPGETHSIQLGVRAPCACFNAVNAGELFFNQFLLLAWGDTLSLTTTPFPVETAELIITQVDNAFLSGSKGELLSRSLTVLNTRPGSLSSFRFQDFYQNGIEVSSPNGIAVANDPGYFAIQLTGTDFQTIGDGDELFEQGESLTITEEILITSCGYNEPSALSNLAISWGCGGANCQSALQTALVQFQPNDLQAELSITPSIQTPACFCAETGIAQGLTIVNTGNEPAFNPLFSIQQLSDGAGIDPGSLSASINGNPVFPTLSFSGSLAFAAPCLSQGPFRESMDIQTSDLMPGDTLTLHWDVFFCTPSCSQASNRWSYQYRFEKSCPPNPIVQVDTIQVYQQLPVFQASLAGDLELEDGETQTYTYSLSYDSLALLDGQLEVVISLPCGLGWGNTDLPLAGVSPDALVVETIDSLQVITATYPLPLPASTVQMSFELFFECESLCQEEFVCADSLLTSCPQPECAEEAGPGLLLDIQSSLLTCPGLPPGCAPQTCKTTKIFFLCEPDSLCIDTISGYVFFDMDFARTNLGLPDNDNDRWPDGPSFQDSSLLRLDRSIPGDTVQTVLNGLVIADQPGATFPHATASLSFQPVGADPDLNAALYTPEGIAALDASLRIWDAGSASYYNCPNLSFWAETTSDRLIYHYQIDPATLAGSGCDLPPGFAWADGDSIRLTARHRLNANPIKQSSMAPSPPIFQVTVRPVLAIGQTQAELEEPFQCGCASTNWEITGYETQLLPGVFAIPFCDTSAYQGSTFFKLEIGAGNFFPYEYRPLGSAPLLNLTLPPGIQLAGAQVKQFTLQQGATWKGITPVTGILENGTWTFDLSPCQDTLADEGFYFLFQYRFTADCTAEGAYPLQVSVRTDFVPELETPADTLWVAAEDNALKILQPTLQLFTPLPNQQALDNKGRWTFTLTNLPNSVSGQQSGPAPHVWLAPFSASGALSDFQLTDTQSGMLLPLSNGIFQLDTLHAGESRTFELVALNESCTEEVLEVRYGFGCTPYNDPAAETCQSAVQYWQVKAPPGGVDLFLTGPDSCALLCDTIPYQTVTVYSTNLGPVCDPFIVASLPPGLSFITGSSQLAYPAGSPFQAVADPEYLGNNEYRWELSELSPELAANCLPGLGATPMHQVSIRFLTETDCGFAINSPILFRSSGWRNCGIPVNTSTRPGNPICIEVEGGNVQTFFQAGLEDPITCQDTGIFNLALVHGAVSAQTDSIRLLLPPGVAYVAESLAPIANAPAGEPFTDTLYGRQRLHWSLPAGLDPFTLVAFQLSLSGFSTLPCGEDYFLLSAGIQAQAVCAANGDTCSIRVETGSELLPLEIQRPILRMDELTAAWDGDSLFASLVISNSTDIPAEDVLIQLWWDADGDGIGDSLLLAPVLPQALVADTLSFALPGGMDLACGLIAVIDSTGQCLCASDTLALMQPVYFRESVSIEGCAGVPVEIGLCLPEWSTQWTAQPGLACDTCCTTTFLTTPPDDSLSLYYFEQHLSNGSCMLVVPHALAIRPEPGIVYSDPVTCAGAGVNLVAGPGTEFLWEGPGLAPVDQQAVTVFPEVDGLYTLSMTDLFGCPGEDTAFIAVLPLPVTDAGPDTVFCPGDVFQLQAFEESGYAYSWSPAAAFQDPALPDPVFSSALPGIYTLEVTDLNGCENTDSVLVDFGTTPLLQMPADTLICAGDTISVQVPGNYTALEWQPQGALSCLNPPVCDSILVIPPESLELTAIATGADGCVAISGWAIEVADESSYTLDTVFTCANEPVWIGDTWTTAPGLYCDTLFLPSGCRQIYCTELFTGDTLFQETTAAICPGDSLEWAGQWYTLPGQYVQPFSTSEGCDSILQLSLVWHALPAFSLLPADTTILEGESVVLMVTGNDASYSWSPSEWLDCNTCRQALASPPETTLFQVWVTDENGCTQQMESLVKVRIDCDPARIQLPNAFTPDGDGLNDTFGILTRAGKEYVVEMQIWNRWGQLVFSSRDGQARWDGSQNGRPAPADEYAYRIVVGCTDGAREVYTGSLTLIR